ncbi:galactoside permease [Alteromonas australica]|uniref:oligosaccharide MFS transporter n=1 Tax=Alteromonas sp. B31-7 TaxID=2785913 RepID=UPI0005C40B7B|nr:oligosaccharide MFS transporter [Alteromonas sp. B31-7]AJP44749.1 galactoside permease [Alteromonas australica]QPL50973.1 oligosaccharide MFS transporter [Alteromonas sp. B31-7]
MKCQLNSAYWSSAITFFSFFLTWSFCYSLFPLWLNQTLALTGKETGVVFATNALAALIIMPVYGILQDRLGTGKQLLFMLGLLMAGVGPFFILIYQPLLTSFFIVGAIVGALYSALTFGAAVGTLEAYIERLGRKHDVEFGKARLWGSLGWACATFVAGVIFNINPKLNFVLASATGVGFILCLFWLPASTKTPRTKKKKVGVSDVLSLFSQSRFWRLSLYVMGVSCLYQIYDQQFPIYFSSLFPTPEEGNRFYGYLNSLQVFIEAGMMFIAPFIVNKIGPKNGLLLSGAIMALRMLASGVVADPVSISLVKLLHALELPILLVAIFKYTAVNFDTRLSATIYLIGFHVFTQVVTTLLSSVIGELYDDLGFADTYLLLGTVVTVNLIFSFWILENNKPKNDVAARTTGGY